MITWKRINPGHYESSAVAFNGDTKAHDPIYWIIRDSSAYRLFVQGKFCGCFCTISGAKLCAQKLEDCKPRYMTDEEEGMAHAHYAPGQVLSAFITAERIGGETRVSEDGEALISETRYPDGHVTVERREYDAIHAS